MISNVEGNRCTGRPRLGWIDGVRMGNEIMSNKCVILKNIRKHAKMIKIYSLWPCGVVVSALASHARDAGSDSRP